MPSIKIEDAYECEDCYYFVDAVAPDEQSARCVCVTKRHATNWQRKEIQVNSLKGCIEACSDIDYGRGVASKLRIVTTIVTLCDRQTAEFEIALSKLPR